MSKPIVSLSEVRETFLRYFERQGHTRFASAPLVPHNDPTLMFTNAGMVPFKNIFTGSETLSDKKGQKVVRAASSQKCVRAGGKHNDLDNVGYTARHHTFFEMLGNFSFGDYFKEGAIHSAWELITKDFGLKPEKLCVTIYHNDEEAYKIWKKLTGFSDDKIIRIATKDNFWAMGDTGPCGPCSEIFYDHGEKIAGGPPGSADQDGDRFIEIWNLVFMQFDAQADGSQIPLPKPCIDTGMGLERVSAVLQGVHDNYEIDLFRELIEISQAMSGNDDPAHHNSHRVIADHIRASSFLLADGVMPSNEGRGYVLRRIMRRAMRHAHTLGAKDPLLYRLVPTLLNLMGDAYPELRRAEALVTQTLRQEEEKFRETLGKGLKLLDEASAHLSKGGVLDGGVAFKLYDTYGFPVDLTQDILRGRGMSVDQKGFDAAMAEQKKKARASWVGSGESKQEAIWFDLFEQHGATEFLGYEQEKATGQIVALVHKGKQVEKVKEGDEVDVLVNQTPFYGESGGQAGDRGTIRVGSAEIAISDTIKPVPQLILHKGRVVKGSITQGAEAQLLVDGGRRSALRGNHSATHLLHAVLRNELGDHVTQKGSLVEAESFRFDFSHAQKVTPEQLEHIEREVNRLIRQNTSVGTRQMTPEDAVEAGAMALFGEKYGAEVRVVNMGEAERGNHYSLELCGGTHVRATGDIGFFKILKESSVASGIRRIEATTGQAAYLFVRDQEAKLDQLATLLKTSPEETVARVEALVEERKKLEREVQTLKKQVAVGGGTSSGQTSAQDDVEKVGDVAFIGKVLPGFPAKDLKGLVDQYKKQHPVTVVALIATEEGKASIVVGVQGSEKHNAVDLVRVGAEKLGGKGGGGRPDMAQAGGNLPDAANDAVAAIRNAL